MEAQGYDLVLNDAHYNVTIFQRALASQELPRIVASTVLEHNSGTIYNSDSNLVKTHHWVNARKTVRNTITSALGLRLFCTNL